MAAEVRRENAELPPKNPWDLLNHTQDAAYPPHTWRDSIFRHRAARPKYAGDAKSTWAEQDGLALPELAPDWDEYR